MSQFRFHGIAEALAGQVRSSMRSPQYGHPAHRAPSSLPAPGPVFIHARECARYDAPELPPDFRSLPLVFEAYRAGGELLARERVGTRAPEEALAALFERSAADYVHIRNGEAGCFMAAVRPLPPH